MPSSTRPARGSDPGGDEQLLDEGRLAGAGGADQHHVADLVGLVGLRCSARGPCGCVLVSHVDRLAVRRRWIVALTPALRRTREATASGKPPAVSLVTVMLNNASVRRAVSGAVDPVARGLLRLARLAGRGDARRHARHVASRRCGSSLASSGRSGVVVILAFVFSDLLDGTMARMSGRSGPVGRLPRLHPRPRRRRRDVRRHRARFRQCRRLLDRGCRARLPRRRGGGLLRQGARRERRRRVQRRDRRARRAAHHRGRRRGPALRARRALRAARSRCGSSPRSPGSPSGSGSCTCAAAAGRPPTASEGST